MIREEQDKGRANPLRGVTRPVSFPWRVPLTLLDQIISHHGKTPPLEIEALHGLG